MRSSPPSNKPTVAPGLLVVDKPAGMTSHDVVNRVRRIVGTRKVGHAGTLDPMATGVLVLGVERGTKLLGHLAMDSKAYLATIRLGASTSTDDAEGELLEEADAGHVSESAIRSGIEALTGELQQVPSAVSAVKVNGRRAYEIARSGETVELAARPVTVSRFDLLSVRSSGSTVDLDVVVECSSGTYVRALARDLGAALETGGHLAALRRTKVGPFGVAVAKSLEVLAEEPELSMDLDTAVATAFEWVRAGHRTARSLAHGQQIPAAGLDGVYGVFDPDGTAVALVRDRGQGAKPVLVLTPAG